MDSIIKEKKESKNIMVNYANSKVYKITSDNCNEVYIGSTTQLLCKRLAGHRAAHRGYLNGNKHFYTSFRILEQGNCHIVLLESVNCNTKEELHVRERYYIEKTSCVNKIKQLNRTEDEKRAYREINSDKINQKFICYCEGKYVHKHRAIHFKSQKHQKHIKIFPADLSDLAILDI